MRKTLLSAGVLVFLLSCQNQPPAQDEAPAQEENKQEEIVEEETVVYPTAVEIVITGETMTDMKFEPARVEVAAGSELTITLSNKATSEAMIHNIVFIEFGAQSEIVAKALEAGPDAGYVPEDDRILASSAMLNPGETDSITFTVPEKKGTYQFICTYPGHTDMKGVLLVR